MFDIHNIVLSSTMIVGLILVVGFVLGESARKLGLPRVTGYIVAGILLNPDLFKLIPHDFAERTNAVTNIALAFITFSVGGTLEFSKIKLLGKSILSIAVFEAEFALIFVAVGMLLFAPMLVDLPGNDWMTVTLPMALLMACLAAPTDPSATLAVVHEFKATGRVTSTIMGVAAMDDALGIINYSLAVAISTVLVQNTQLNLGSAVGHPLLIIGGSVALGITLGILFNLICRYLKRESEGILIVVVLGSLLMCFGAASLFGIDELLTTMTMGITVTNFNPLRDKIFGLMQRYLEELVIVLFFTMACMHLDLDAIRNAALLIVVFVIFRAMGKAGGTMLGAKISGADPLVRKYTFGGLLPQGGIVIGLALMMKQQAYAAGFADIIIGVVVGATVVHELIGPLASKFVLRKAGEIKPQNYMSKA